MVIFYFVIALTVIYSIRVTIYLAWLYFQTEKTIKDCKLFEQKSSNRSYNAFFTGDSLTYGAGASDPNKSIAGLFYSDNPNFAVHNKSVNKITTRAMLSQMDGLRNSNTTYTYSVLSIGGNDIVQFRSMRGIEERIRDIVKILETVSENIYIFTPTKPGKSPLVIKWIVINRVKKLRRIVQSLESNSVHHVDMWKAGDKLLAHPEKYFVKDTLHLSDEGQSAWYTQLRKVMNK